MSQLPASTKAITLAHYPKGLPTLDTFHTVELPLPAELQPGEVLTTAQPQPTPTKTRLSTLKYRLHHTTRLGSKVALRAEWLSVDPYLRGRMREGAKSYVPPFELNKPIVSGIVARVIASKDDNFKVGDRAIST